MTLSNYGYDVYYLPILFLKTSTVNMLILTDVTKLRRNAFILFHANSIYGCHNVISLFKAHVNPHQRPQRLSRGLRVEECLSVSTAALWV